MKGITLLNLATTVPFIGAVLIVIWLSATAKAPSPLPFSFYAGFIWVLASFLSSITFLILSRWIKPSLRKTRCQDALSVVTLVTFLAIITTVIKTAWPVRLAHTYSRSGFDNLAVDAKLGHKTTTPRSVGLFMIDEIELDNGLVCLWLPTSHYLDQKGFVHGSSQRVLQQYQYYEQVVKLDGNWWFVHCDG